MTETIRYGVTEATEVHIKVDGELLKTLLVDDSVELQIYKPNDEDN